MNVRFEIVNKQTGEVVGKYLNRSRARRRADKLDLEYGAINYHVNTVFPDHQVRS